jgi:hypothetical protein
MAISLGLNVCVRGRSGRVESLPRNILFHRSPSSDRNQIGQLALVIYKRDDENAVTTIQIDMIKRSGHKHVTAP